MSVSRQESILRLADEQAFVRPRDVERMGSLVRDGRGLYRRPDAPITEHYTLVEVCARGPAATICLLSALRFRELTTQRAYDDWIALPRNSRTPRLDAFSLRVHRFSGAALTEGRERHVIEGMPVHVYSPAKTVADCFKYRHKIGLDIAIEALRDCLRERRGTVDELIPMRGSAASLV